MSKILLTGMTSPQTTRTTNERAMSFAGLLHAALKDAGHSVTWGDPMLGWDRDILDAYDAVLVGIAPLGSMAANRAYGALHVIDTMRGSDKLTLYIDGPEPSLIATSLRAVHAKPETLFKPLYERRKFYSEAQEPETSKGLLRAVQGLCEGDWPVTLYAGLPWRGDGFKSQMPSGVYNKLVSVNLDSYLLNPTSDDNENRYATWVSDTANTPWVSSVSQGLVNPVAVLPSGISRSDIIVRGLLLGSLGALVSPHKRTGTWWTPLYAHAMNTSTPIATDWQDSQRIGPAWSYLPAQIEAMSPADRNAVAVQQKAEYLQAIETREQARLLLETEVLRATGKDH